MKLNELGEHFQRAREDLNESGDYFNRLGEYLDGLGEYFHDRACYFCQLAALLHSCETLLYQLEERNFCRAGEKNGRAGRLNSCGKEKNRRAIRKYGGNSRK